MTNEIEFPDMEWPDGDYKLSNGDTVYIIKYAINTPTPARVRASDGRIEINKRRCREFPKHVNYFWYRWCLHKYDDGRTRTDLEADMLAFDDMKKLGCDMKEIYKYYLIGLGLSMTEDNRIRVTKCLDGLLDIQDSDKKIFEQESKKLFDKHEKETDEIVKRSIEDYDPDSEEGGFPMDNDVKI